MFKVVEIIRHGEEIKIRNSSTWVGDKTTAVFRLCLSVPDNAKKHVMAEEALKEFRRVSALIEEALKKEVMKSLNP